MVSGEARGVCSGGGGVVAGVWGRSPQQGPGRRAPGQGGRSPLKLKSFEPCKRHQKTEEDCKFVTLLSIM